MEANSVILVAIFCVAWLILFFLALWRKSRAKCKRKVEVIMLRCLLGFFFECGIYYMDGMA